MHINCFFSAYSSFKNITVTKAMLNFLALTNQKIIQFIYPSF